MSAHAWRRGRAQPLAAAGRTVHSCRPPSPYRTQFDPVGSGGMRRNGRHQEDKIALVLAGGGMTGAVYEIGALRAIDDLLIDRTVNDFDIYVGTSAGALVATFIANGLSPEEMLQV